MKTHAPDAQLHATARELLLVVRAQRERRVAASDTCSQTWGSGTPGNLVSNLMSIEVAAGSIGHCSARMRARGRARHVGHVFELGTRRWATTVERHS